MSKETAFEKWWKSDSRIQGLADLLVSNSTPWTSDGADKCLKNMAVKDVAHAAWKAGLAKLKESLDD